MDAERESKGRRENDAQPLGERAGLVSNKKTREVGKAEQRSAGPDGPDAAASTLGRKPSGVASRARVKPAH